MKTVFLALVGLLVLTVNYPLSAQTTNGTPVRGPEIVTAVVETLSSTDTVRGISIGTQTATSVIVSTSAGYRFVAVQNNDATASVYCAERVNVSTLTANNSVGIEVAPRQLVHFSVRAYTDFFCLSNSTSTATRCATFRGR